MAPGETPDYGRLSAQATVFPVTDLGELAARLGSPVIFNRSGDVLFLDDFEAGLARWDQSTTGTGGGIGLSLARHGSGLLSARLVGGSTGSRSAQINALVPLTSVGRVGAEVFSSFVGGLDFVSWNLTVRDGTNATEFIVRYDQANTRLEYENSVGTYTPFDTAFVPAANSLVFAAYKLVVDPTARQYVRFLVGGRLYDLSGAAGFAQGGTTNREVSFTVRLQSRAGQNDTIYVDDAILTQNEPA